LRIAPFPPSRCLQMSTHVQGFPDVVLNTSQGLYSSTSKAYNVGESLSLTPVSGGAELSGKIKERLAIGPELSAQTVLIETPAKAERVVKVFEPEFNYDEYGLASPPSSSNLERPNRLFTNEKLAYEAFKDKAEVRNFLLPYYGAYKVTVDGQICHAIVLGYNKGTVPTNSLPKTHAESALKATLEFLGHCHSAGVAHTELTKPEHYRMTVRGNSVSLVIIDWSHAQFKDSSFEFASYCAGDELAARWLFTTWVQSK